MCVCVFHGIQSGVRVCVCACVWGGGGGGGSLGLQDLEYASFNKAYLPSPKSICEPCGSS